MVKVEANNWLLNSDIECGNAEEIKNLDGSKFTLSPREDPLPREIQKKGPVSAYMLYCEITNLAEEHRQVTLDIMIPSYMIENGLDILLHRPYLLRSPYSLEWHEIKSENQHDMKDRVQLCIGYNKGEKKILSTSYVYPYSAACKKLQELEKQSQGKAYVKEIGKSIEGRPILSLEIGTGNRPYRAVFAGTVQPGEPSAWGVLSMAEAAVSELDFIKGIEVFDISFIPQPNPDGIVHGNCNVNSRDELLLLGFEAVGHNEDNFHEAKVLWNYLAQRPPTVLIDFHFLQLPNHDLPKPYIIDPGLYTDPIRKRAAFSLGKRLIRLSGCKDGNNIQIDHPMWKSLLTYQAIFKWNTVSFLYQYTGPTTSYKGAQAIGIKVMQAALDEIRGI